MLMNWKMKGARVGQLIQLAKAAKLSLKKYLFMYCWCLFFTIAYTCCAMFFPSIVGRIIDNGISDNNFQKVLYESCWLPILGGLMIFFQYKEKINFAKLSQSMTITIQNRLMEKVTKTNYRFWKYHKAGDVHAVIEKDVSRLESLLTSSVNDAVISVFVIIGVAAYLLCIDLLMGSIIIILALIFATIQKKIGDVAKAEMHILRNYMGNVSTLTNHVVNNALSIRMFDGSKKILSDFNFKVSTYRNQYIKQIKILSVVQLTGMTFNAIGLFVIMILGAKKVFVGELSVGVLFSLTLYMQRLYNPLVSLGNVYVSLKSLIPIVGKILDILENSDEIESGTYNPERMLTGQICLQNIEFKYEDSTEYIFKNLNLQVMPGETIGIIGNNGSGKTTLLRLLSRICVVDNGAILVDGVDNLQYDDEYLCGNIGIMSQDNYLPDWTLKDIFDCDDIELENAKYLMNYLNFPIEKFPNGLDSKIGENKIALSGGEIQKIAFIRLILQNKMIYIMDEPTSALDVDSENKMIELIETRLKGKTCIIITHRDAVLKICNRVVDLMSQ